MNYKEKLKDPKWQKKKSEIMMRDGFTCQLCGSTEKTLHVHHLTYTRCKDGNPWACPDSDLITLCEDCHKEVHNNPDIPFPFDEDMTKEVIKKYGLEPYQIIGEFVRREGLFKYYSAPLTRIIDVADWAEEWGAILEMTHYDGDFLGDGLNDLKNEGWQYITGSSTLYENKRLPWDEQSKKLEPRVERAKSLLAIWQFFDDFCEKHNGKVEKSDIKLFFDHHNIPMVDEYILEFNRMVEELKNPKILPF